ncbi:DeoR/GlpR family DNA-binding transcription regulator [Sporolactobacillus shoreicorticis]|uniref:Lactose phosphotransferase system repressor n=1 Tax=Sporolactobacillus shoreicorticis TaxID=1923877 RepID=A0ABW5S0A6_9BACL|nr:DeoR/GlpR family DNA-binding transcription regulator [Sporolactobacillus shoreicorticis]MCO7124643.1 DeoR/GlpR family DNA-binding transcription regulator [Sporolactobacillus shoreicorticis]
MLKEERFKKIIDLVDKHATVSVNALAERLGVTKMTIRRDLNDLEHKQLLVRIHGGAKKTVPSYMELSHEQKRTININEKKHVAQKCAQLIHDDGYVFIGPGTTNELIFDYLHHIHHLDVITNAITIFERFKNDARFDVILIGGRYRMSSGTFIGYFANKMLSEIKVGQAFVGVNGVMGTSVTIANEEEGNGQRIILNNADERYVTADHTKFGVEAFHHFYKVSDLTAIVTDPAVSQQNIRYYEHLTQLIR